MEIKDVLERIALPARSNKHGWKDTTKLEEIEKLLKESDSSFEIVHKTQHTWIFGQKKIEKGENCVLVSTHADIVDGIKNPFSELDEEKHYFKGTYDNLGTNAACVSLMLNEDIPDNVYFAFNDEEETGRCLGAEDALSYVRKSSEREPVVFALDVTDEGYDHNRLFTVEGLHAGNDNVRRIMLEKMMRTEGEEQSFEVVRLKKKDDVSFLPKSYVSDELTVFDESVFYAKQGCTSCSICLPGEGAMHSDSGFYVKEAVMRGYEKGLLALVYEFTNTHEEELESLKAEKDALVKQAKETEFRKHEYMSYYSGLGSSYSGGSYRGLQGRVEYDPNCGMTEEEWEEYVDYNRSFGVYDDYYDNLTDDERWDYFMDQMFAEAYEIVDGYTDDEYDVFYQDMCEMYGVEDCEEMQSMMKEVWRDSKEGYYEEDYDEYGYDE